MNVHSNLMRGHMLIGGELVASEGGEWLESVNPATEETLGHVPAATAADVNRAVTVAEAAQPAWAALDPKARAKLLRQLAAKLRENTDNILRTEVIDTGNTISKMRADVASAGDTLDYYAGFHSEIKGETISASVEEPAFDAARAIRRGGADHSVQSSDDVRRQGASGAALGRQYRGGQAAGNEPALRLPTRRDLARRRRPPASSISSPATAGRSATHWRATRPSAHRLHELGADRPVPSSCRRRRRPSSMSRSSSAAKTR